MAEEIVYSRESEALDLEDPPQIVVHYGMSGGGKTYALKREVEKTEKRVIVFDRKREWFRRNAETGKIEIDIDVGTCGTGTKLEHAEKAFKRTYEPDNPNTPRVMIIQPERKTDLRRLAEGLADIVMANQAVFVSAEAHRIAPNRGVELTALSEPLGELAGAFRHHLASWYLDSQRPSKLHHDITEQATTLRIFALAGDRDTEFVRGYLGGNIMECMGECAQKLAAKQPGWHVSIDPRNPVPPYKVERYK